MNRRPAARTRTAEATPLMQRYAKLRAATMALAAPLSEADCQAQSMPDASPTRWHLAHVTWFFETFVLQRFEPDFKPHHPAFRQLFNSYYQGVGEPFARAQRGLVTRPGLTEIKAYRAAVDERMAALLACSLADEQELQALVELGLQHEQQHQELILTDLKHLLSINPLSPAYHGKWPLANVAAVEPGFVSFAGGQVEIGHRGTGFAFDNESPRHPVWLQPYALGNRLVTHGEWAEFVADGGYREARWWLSAGWDWVRAHNAQAPLYWRGSDAQGWRSFTLHGEVAIDPHTPIVHINLYEADAYARWRGAQQGQVLRLPTEAE